MFGLYTIVKELINKNSLEKLLKMEKSLLFTVGKCSKQYVVLMKTKTSVKLA